jgi:hypothetical protein
MPTCAASRTIPKLIRPAHRKPPYCASTYRLSAKEILVCSDISFISLIDWDKSRRQQEYSANEEEPA